MRRRKADFVGFRKDVIHGQEVEVKVFRSVTEPSLEVTKVKNWIMWAVGDELTKVTNHIEKYQKDLANFQDVELEEGDLVGHDFNARIQPDIHINRTGRPDEPSQVSEDIPVDSNGLPMPVDKYYRNKKIRS